MKQKVEIDFKDDGSVSIKGLKNNYARVLSNDEYIYTSNGYLFWFDTGRFDDWCVYCMKPNNQLWFAYDKEYLSWIRKMGKFYGEDKVYDGFVRIYDSVSFDFDVNYGYNVICDVAKKYNSNTEHYWTWFWMTMVAEERKEGVILGKRIKRLGVYNILFDKLKLSYVVKYMVRKDWRELDEYCFERGF